MLIKTIKWRAAFKADELVNEKFPEEVFGNLSHIYGKDKEGRPVTYVFTLVLTSKFGPGLILNRLGL